MTPIGGWLALPWFAAWSGRLRAYTGVISVNQR
jgi:hypothetical protein